MRQETGILQECLARLRELEPVRDAEFQAEPAGQADGRLALKTDQGRLHYVCQIKRGLNQARLKHALLLPVPRRLARGSRTLLLTDSLPASLFGVLAESETDFVDSAGNMLLRWPGKLHVQVLGLKPTRPAESAAGLLTTPAGLRVVFALLADNSQRIPSYREIVERSGVALGSVSRVAAELKRRGFLEGRQRARRVLRRKRDLLDLWVGGYTERLRPRLVVGRFQSPERDPADSLAMFVSQAHAERMSWAVTGGFAADLLTGHYRGDRLVLFVEPWRATLAASMRWMPSAHGPITVLRPFWPAAAGRTLLRNGTPAAHPLLVYAELLFDGREREVETARRVYDQYLATLVRDAEA